MVVGLRKKDQKRGKKMERLLLKELEQQLAMLEELKQAWERINRKERINRNDKYLEGRIDGLAMVIDLIHQLNQK